MKTDAHAQVGHRTDSFIARGKGSAEARNEAKFLEAEILKNAGSNVSRTR